MDPVEAGTVRVGLKQIEFRTLVREILPDPAPVPGQPQKLGVMDVRGDLMLAPDNVWVASKPGDRMFFVEATSRAKGWGLADLRNAIATLNLSTGASYIEKAWVGYAAVPPFNQFFVILSGSILVFGLLFFAPQNIVFMIPSAGYLLWVRMRMKKVRRAVEAIIAKARAQAPA